MHALPQPLALADAAIRLHTPGWVARTPADAVTTSRSASVAPPHSPPHAHSTSGTQPMHVDETVRELFPNHDDGVATATAGTRRPMRPRSPPAVVTPGASPM